MCFSKAHDGRRYSPKLKFEAQINLQRLISLSTWSRLPVVFMPLVWPVTR